MCVCMCVRARVCVCVRPLQINPRTPHCAASVVLSLYFGLFIMLAAEEANRDIYTHPPVSSENDATSFSDAKAAATFSSAEAPALVTTRTGEFQYRGRGRGGNTSGAKATFSSAEAPDEYRVGGGEYRRGGSGGPSSKGGFEGCDTGGEGEYQYRGGGGGGPSSMGRFEGRPAEHDIGGEGLVWGGPGAVGSNEGSRLARLQRAVLGSWLWQVWARLFGGGRSSAAVIPVGGPRSIRHTTRNTTELL